MRDHLYSVASLNGGSDELDFRPGPERSRLSRKQPYPASDASRAIKLEQFTSGTETKTEVSQY
jgi:hypothetical protein